MRATPTMADVRSGPKVRLPDPEGAKLMMRVLAFERDKGSSPAVGAEARQLVADLAAWMAREEGVLVGLARYHLVTRSGWIYFSRSRVVQQCIRCGKKTKKGAPVWWREDNSKMAMCGPCGTASREVERGRMRLVESRAGVLANSGEGES